MDGSKSVYLSNGDELILLDEQYFISKNGIEQPRGIEREEGERILFETCQQLKAIIENQGNTKIKFLRELDVMLQDDDIDEDERITSFAVCECVKCHWRFIGDCERYGYGFTSQGVQIPDYCPMCGSKIEDTLEDS